uniref:Tubulin binding cofactor C-like domain-containing protein n=1 Tax=Panagrolaimus sp. PS1159 TaxID=55785 RepID=A0AC35F5Q7_9BILA
MYALDEFEIKSRKLSLPESTRSITSTILPQHRKLSVRKWSHMEILNNTVYRNINLRISDGNYLSKSSFIFHLTTLKSVVISDCSDISPIILGPVTDFIILRNLHNCRISVITKRLLIIDCDNLMIFLSSETNPIISGASMNICFGPYNVWFNALEMELNQANLVITNNCNYINPVYVSSTYKQHFADAEIKAEERFQILPETNFYLQPTPLPSLLPYSKAFVESLGNYLASFLERRKSAENYLKKLTMPEIELLTPLSTDDLHYLKKKINLTKK